MDICGPFTLEDLDQFNSSIDALPFSLDDPIWESPNTCIVFSGGAVVASGTTDVTANATFLVSGSITADANVVTNADRLRTVSGEIQASGDVDAEVTKEMFVAGDIVAAGDVVVDGDRIRTVSGDITASGFVETNADRLRLVQGLITASASIDSSANAIFGPAIDVSASAQVVSIADRIRTISGAITATGTMEADIDLEAFAVGFVLGEAFVVTAISVTYNSQALIAANADVSASLYIFGEEWVNVPDEANTWTPQAVQSDTWTDVPADSNTWNVVTVQFDNWTTTNTGNNTWLKQG